MARNPYLPYPARIEDVLVENEARDIKTFRLAFEDPASAAAFQHVPGQFAGEPVVTRAQKDHVRIARRRKNACPEGTQVVHVGYVVVETGEHRLRFLPCLLSYPQDVRAHRFLIPCMMPMFPFPRSFQRGGLHSAGVTPLLC